jgi:hypothetical protein
MQITQIYQAYQRLPTHNICANSIYHWIKEIISYIKTNITATVLLAQRLLQILYQGINLILNLSIYIIVCHQSFAVGKLYRNKA